MNTEERQMIQGLFGRLGEAERTAPPRDAQAEALIRDEIAGRPAAPYYMAQTMIVQEEALKAANARIQELERAASERPEPAGGGSFLGGLFGGGGSRDPERPMGVPAGYGDPARGNLRSGGPDMNRAASGPWGSAPSVAPMAGRFGGGGGFLAGAAQTAVGVAGGVMLGSMLGNLFDGSGHSFLGGGNEGAQADAGTDHGGGVENTGLDEGGSAPDADVENSDYQDMGEDDLGSGDFDEI